MDVLIHLDEICLKGNNQRVFYRYLINNLQQHFPGATVRRVAGGLKLCKIDAENFPRLQLIPGIANFAPVFSAKLDIKSMEEVIKKIDFGSVKKFRISASRSNKIFLLSSQQIERTLGAAVNKKWGWQVDLKNYDLKIHVEINSKESLIYGNVTQGIGGLPARISGKILCLLSGGIDSPVAAFNLIKRGVETVLIHFQNQTKVEDEVSAKVLDLAQILARVQGGIKLIIVPFASLQHEIVKKVPADMRMITSRRLMFKIANIIANQEHCLGLATGDSIGQVASQTLPNLQCVYAAAEIPVYTPLCGQNKKDIVNTAKTLGTLDISNRPYEDCCSLFVAKHPQTALTLKKALLAEKDIALPSLDNLNIISYNLSMNYGVTPEKILWGTK